MSKLRYVGNPNLQNVDGMEKVTGRARYVADMRVPGMLVAKVLRSPHPHAKIVSLDPAPALAVPGVRAVITHADFVDHGAFGWPIRDAYILAYRKVRYVGEPVAVVAAETEEAARAGVEAIQVRYAPLPVVSDMTHALDPGAPLIPAVSPTGQGNLCNTHLVRNGNPDPLLAEAAVTFETTISLPHQEHAYLETEGVREQRRRILPNPHQQDEKKRGLETARWLLDEGVDGVVTREGLEGKAPGYVFNDAGVFTCAVEAEDLDTVLLRLSTHGICGYLD